MLYKTVSVAFAATAVSGFSPAMPSKLAASKVARVSDIEMAKKSVGDLSKADLEGKRVLVRCDLNVPLVGKTITDDTRIRASIPTVKYLMDNGAKVLLASHLGRPKSGPEDKFSLAPVAPRLSELLGKDVKMAPDCIGEGVASVVAGMANGDVTLLENNAVLLANGKMAVDSIAAVLFVSGEKDDGGKYNFHTPCPATSERIKKFDAEAARTSSATFTAPSKVTPVPCDPVTAL